MWALHLGPKTSIMTASALSLVGNWIRYGGTYVAGRDARFGVVLFGQILIGFAQPFVLCAPTRYSDMWFTDRGRVSATAVASLANPFGGAVSTFHHLSRPILTYEQLGQLISPFWATKASEVPNAVLYIAIIVRFAPTNLHPAFELPIYTSAH
jgi:MFS transporter, FLVCR family, MFS-domain-containing protein 7